jgi:DNA-binding NarL/FixJ family response regulator
MNPKIKIMLIDDDPIFSLGLTQIFNSFRQIDMINIGVYGDDILQIINQYSSVENLDLLILSSTLDRDFQQIEQIKFIIPDLPILLLIPFGYQTNYLQNLDIEGYYIKGSPIQQLLTNISQILGIELKQPEQKTGLLTKISQQGLGEIEQSLNYIQNQLQTPNLSALDKIIFNGIKRELKTARWLVSHILPTNKNLLQPIIIYPLPPVETPSKLTIFDIINEQLDYPLNNLTNMVLEIDILQESKKRYLLKIILKNLQNILKQLQDSQLQIEQITMKKSQILADLWQTVVIDYFGKYATINIDNNSRELVGIILKDQEIIRETFLDKIPLVNDLIGYLLFSSSLIIDNVTYPAESQPAQKQAEILIDNLAIALANAVIQPLLNNLADVEEIKQNFYDSKLLSSREIAKLRNNLSWQYRWKEYIIEPTAIFESQYRLMYFTEKGIEKTSIYAVRNQELKQLNGLQLLVTLGLEIKDAISPRLQAVTKFLGQGIVYLLTQIIGKGIGLIGKGIIQAIGSTLQETKFGKK